MDVVITVHCTVGKVRAPKAGRRVLQDALIVMNVEFVERCFDYPLGWIIAESHLRR
jgi:hypothetical protein